MHVKVATLCIKHALGSWICGFEALHVSVLAYMEIGSRDTASPKVELGDFYEDGLRLGELEEQLSESYEDFLVLDELFIQLCK